MIKDNKDIPSKQSKLAIGRSIFLGHVTHVSFGCQYRDGSNVYGWFTALPAFVAEKKTLGKYPPTQINLNPHDNPFHLFKLTSNTRGMHSHL